MTTTLGAFLRSKREERGIALEEMAEKTRIPLRYLSALEEDRLDALPGKVYERLFIRTYADLVGINVEELGRQFKEIQNTLELKVRPEDERRSPFLKRGIYALGFLTVILVGVLIFIRREPEPAAAPEPEVIPNLVPSQSADSFIPQAPAAPPEPESLHLKLETAETNWVRIWTDGKMVLEAELKPGESKAFAAEKKLRLSLGRARAADLWINGHRLKKLGRERATLINFELTHENYPALIDSAANP
ncbi:MAG TPA: RodZ domain-containing protein [Verrucomicrobiae bacterium]|nr:RodZ domain-containing protein [Verrucomicrobiae bacterium]